MDTLETLLKVAQSHLDEVSREAGIAAERMGQLNRELLSMDDRQQAARTDFDVSLMVAAGDFRGRLRSEREQLKQAIEEERKSLDEIRARLTLAFREKSKFEQLLARQEERAKQAEAAREQKALDEAAIRLANRR